MAEKQKKTLFGKLPFLKKPQFSALLMTLFLVFALTSGMVGFLLGRGASRAGGELIDTIVLSPGDSHLSRDTLRLLSGRLRHSSGEPFAGATVRLGSTGKTDVTDERGKFYFSDVRSGSHALTVLNEEGSVLTELEVSLDFSGDAVSADFSGQPFFQMPEDARMLEFTLVIGQDQALEIDGESAYFVTKDGQIVDFGGSALKLKDSSRAVTPAGSLVTSPGYVVLPVKGTVVTPRGEQAEVPPGLEIIPGVVVEEDGSVKLEEGPVLLPGGEVQLPGGETVGGGDTVVIITDEEAEEVPQLPDEYTPPRKEPVEEVPGGEPSEPEREPPGSEASEPELSEPESSESEALDPIFSEPEVSEPESSEPVSSQPELYQGLSVLDRETGISWKQQSMIDLFKNRTDSMNLGEEGGLQLVAPGSKGYYEFRLENPESFDIAYTVSLVETSFHLPIRYSVVDTANNYGYLYRERIFDAGEPLKTQEIVIPSGKTQNFRIDWEWDYEDWYRPEKDNPLDTQAGSKLSDTERTYMLSVMIEAEQILKEPETSLDGDIRYPGVH